MKKAAKTVIETLSGSPRKEKTLSMKSQSTLEDQEDISPGTSSTLSQTSLQSYITSLSVTASNISNSSSTSGPSPCGRCRKIVKRGDDALECEICQQWFHVKCEEISKAQYKVMLECNKEGKKKTKLHWYCKTCDCHTVDLLKLKSHQHKTTQRTRMQLINMK